MMASGKELTLSRMETKNIKFHDIYYSPRISTENQTAWDIYQYETRFRVRKTCDLSQITLNFMAYDFLGNIA